jgi:hypothetical protein
MLWFWVGSHEEYERLLVGVQDLADLEAERPQGAVLDRVESQKPGRAATSGRSNDSAAK